MSMARALQAAGIHAVTYDQRGAGDSTVDGWNFGLRDHALVDLPAVLRACRRELGLDRVVLAGHSLGGTIWLRYVESRVGQRPHDEPAIGGGLAIASPSEFDRSFSPWSDIARRGRGFVERVDRNRDAITSRQEFSGAQVWIYWKWSQWIVTPGVVGFFMRLGERRLFWARQMRTAPLPSLVYRPDDFDDATFQKVLRSKTLDRGAHQLLLELVDEVLGPLPPAKPPLDLDVLCVGSVQDRLVPLRTVQAFARRFSNARVIATEDAYGHASGHVGYFYKDAFRGRVAADAIAHVHRVLG
jgi:pimeloyl-ACP methyl ester carboxylesterase